MKESPRWLLTKGLYEQANEVIAVIAKTNKKEIPAGYLTKLQEDVSLPLSLLRMWLTCQMYRRTEHKVDRRNEILV